MIMLLDRRKIRCVAKSRCLIQISCILPTDSDNRGETFYSDEIPDNMHSQIVPVSHKDAHQIQSVCHQISISGLQAFSHNLFPFLRCLIPFFLLLSDASWRYIWLSLIIVVTKTIAFFQKKSGIFHPLQTFCISIVNRHARLL